MGIPAYCVSCFSRRIRNHEWSNPSGSAASTVAEHERSDLNIGHVSALRCGRHGRSPYSRADCRPIGIFNRIPVGIGSHRSVSWIRHLRNAAPYNCFTDRFVCIAWHRLCGIHVHHDQRVGSSALPCERARYAAGAECRRIQYRIQHELSAALFSANRSRNISWNCLRLCSKSRYWIHRRDLCVCMLVHHSQMIAIRSGTTLLGTANRSSQRRRA